MIEPFYLVLLTEGRPPGQRIVEPCSIQTKKTYAQVSCILFGCCHLFPPLWRLCFFFSTLVSRLPPLRKHKCVSTVGKCPLQDKCPMSLTFLMSSTKYLLVEFSVSHFNEPSPQPGNAAVGSVTDISSFSKRVRRSAWFSLLS